MTALSSILAARSATFSELAKAVAAAAPPPAQPPVASAIERVQQRKAMGLDGSKMQMAEIERICALPIYGGMDRAEIDAFQREAVLAEAYEDGFRLFDIQAEAVASYQMLNGLFGPIPVGSGKTLVTLAIANAAYTKGLTKMLLMVPAPVYGQLVQTDIRWARSRIPITYPIMLLGGRESAARIAIAKSGKRGLYVLPYSLLSVKDTHTVLEGIDPQIIIADEAHKLANPGSARTKRIRHFVEKKHPEFVALSGTITSKSIQDYYHLLKWCLREANPLPNSTSLAMDWAAVLDAQPNEGVQAGPGAGLSLVPLVEWAQKHFPTEKIDLSLIGFRKAYKLRMRSAPGVVASQGDAVGTSLILANRPVDGHESSPGWSELHTLIEKVEQMWLTPNGDQIEHAIHTYKWMYELSNGFYNELTWPTPEKLRERKKLAPEEADVMIDMAKLHHAAGQVYAKLLRDWLKDKSRPGLDTPLLVGMDMSRNGSINVGHDLYDAWQDWHRLDFEGRPERDSRAVRVCPFKVNDAVAWAKERKGENPDLGGLIWVWHIEIGKWIYEELVKAGVDALYCPAGNEHNTSILNPVNTGKIVVASIAAHGTGKNLQAFQQQYFMQWPRQAMTAEQVIGRTHRHGQKADELVVVTNRTLEFDRINFSACLNDSCYIQQTTGLRQKLIYASYDPLPKIYPSAFLIEKGLEAKVLDAAAKKVLDEKFTT